MNKAHFIAYIAFALGELILFALILGMLGDIKTTMQDDRAILSDMRDALNCQTWPYDTACTTEYAPQ